MLDCERCDLAGWTGEVGIHAVMCPGQFHMQVRNAFRPESLDQPMALEGRDMLVGTAV